MPKKPRIVLENYNLVEITNRTIHSRLLLRPSEELNDIIRGAVARAQEKYGVVIHALVFLSNHYHLLASFVDARQMSRFVSYYQAKIAKEVARMHGWGSTVWADRYDDVPVHSSEADQVARLRYLLTQGCKEGLVSSPREWPGVHCVDAMLSGEMMLEGFWPDRTEESRARHRGEDVPLGSFREEARIQLSPLPCWGDLTKEEYGLAVAGLVDEIERETAAHHKVNKSRPLGVPTILRQDPQNKPRDTARSPKPPVHALAAAARMAFCEANRTFVSAYRAAADLFAVGCRDVVFPVGCFPPGLPFVTALAET